MNAFDIAVLTIVIISSLLALFRGLLREVLSLVAWIAAAIITFFSYNRAGHALAGTISNEMLAKAAGGLGVFLISLISLSIINALILKAARKAEVGPLDRSLGFAFGFMRGVFIVSVAYMVFDVVMSKREKPEWFQEASTGHLVEMGSTFLGKLAPSFLTEVEDIAKMIAASKDEDQQASTTRETGFLEALLLRTSFSSLTSEERETLRSINEMIPPMQPPRGVSNPNELTTKEASNLMMNMVRLYQKLEKQQKIATPEGKEPVILLPDVVNSLANKLMIVYMQSRDEAPPTNTPSKDGKAGLDKIDPAAKKMLEQVESLQKAVQPQ